MEKLNSILNGLLKANSRYKEYELEQILEQKWPEIVGARLAQQCWIGKILDPTTLLIYSENASLLYQLRFLEKNILSKINQAVASAGNSKFQKIVFKHGTAKKPT